MSRPLSPLALADAVYGALNDPATARASLSPVDAARIREVLDARDTALAELVESGLDPVTFVGREIARRQEVAPGFLQDMAGMLGLDGDAVAPIELARHAQASMLAGLAGVEDWVGAPADTGMPALREVASAARFFASPLGDASERPIVEALTGAVLPLLRGSEGQDATLSDAGTVAVGLDLGMSAVKAGVQVAQGTLGLGDAVEALGARAAAAVAAGLRQPLQDAGGKLGAAVGGFIAGVVGLAPVGAAVGAVLGRLAGATVADVVEAGAQKVGGWLARKAVALAGSAARLVTKPLAWLGGVFA
jgi:hypothetical protein